MSGLLDLDLGAGGFQLLLHFFRLFLLHAFLELGSGFGCETNGAVLLITDGIESSSVVSAKALLDGKAVLPAPGPNLRGCVLTFYGLGAGWELQQVKNLKVAWSQWAKKAGADFRAISP